MNAAELSRLLERAATTRNNMAAWRYVAKLCLVETAKAVNDVAPLLWYVAALNLSTGSGFVKRGRHFEKAVALQQSTARLDTKRQG